MLQQLSVVLRSEVTAAAVWLGASAHDALNASLCVRACVCVCACFSFSAEFLCQLVIFVSDVVWLGSQNGVTGTSRGPLSAL